MKYVLHRGTGTLVAVSECEIVDDTDWTKDEGVGSYVTGIRSEHLAGVSLSSVLEKLA